MLCLSLSIDNIKQYEFIEVSKVNGLYIIDRKDQYYRIKISSLTLKSTCNHFHYIHDEEKFILFPTNEEVYSLSLTATKSKTRKRKFELNTPIDENLIKNYINHIIKYFKDILKYDVAVEIIKNPRCIHCENDVSEIIATIKLPLIELKKIKINNTTKRLRSIFKPILLLKNKFELGCIIEKLVINTYSKLQLYYMHEKNKNIYIGLILIVTIANHTNQRVTYHQDFPSEIFDVLFNDDNSNDNSNDVNNKLLKKITNALINSLNEFITYITSKFTFAEDICINDIGIKLINNNTIFAGAITFTSTEFNELQEQEQEQEQDDFKICTVIRNIPTLHENYDTNSFSTVDIISELSKPLINAQDGNNDNMYNISSNTEPMKQRKINDNSTTLLETLVKPKIFSELLLLLTNENAINNFIAYYNSIDSPNDLLNTEN